MCRVLVLSHGALHSELAQGSGPPGQEWAFWGLLNQMSRASLLVLKFRVGQDLLQEEVLHPIFFLLPRFLFAQV